MLLQQRYSAIPRLHTNPYSNGDMGPQIGCMLGTYLRSLPVYLQSSSKKTFEQWEGYTLLLGPQALPIFLDRLADPITAVLLSITVVLIFGVPLNSASCRKIALACSLTQLHSLIRAHRCSLSS